jgi:hypothetical protein
LGRKSSGDKKTILQISVMENEKIAHKIFTRPSNKQPVVAELFKTLHYKAN